VAYEQQRLRAGAVELRIQEKERKTAEVIAVKVADDDRGDRRRIHTRRFEANEARGATIDQAPPFAVFDENASL